MTKGVYLSIMRTCKVFVTLLITVHCVCTFLYAQDENRSKEMEEFDFANGLLSRGMYDMAAKGYEDFIKRYAKSSYLESAEYRKAEAYFLSGKYDKAIEGFSSFLKKYPSTEITDKARLRIAQSYYLRDDYAQAQKMLSELKDKESVAVPAKYYLANVYHKQGDYTTSMNMLKGVLSEVNDAEYTAFTHISIGDIYAELGKYPEAAEAYKKASISTPNKSLVEQALSLAGGAYYVAGDYENAKVFYKKVTDTVGGSDVYDQSAVGLFLTLYKNGEYDVVTEYLETILPLVKDENAKAQMLFIAGNSYFNEDRFSNAEKIYAEAANLYPDTKFGVKSKLNECWMLYKLGEHEKCLSSIEAYEEKTKDQLDEVLYIRAKVFKDTGKQQDALATYERIVKEFKNSDFHREALYDIGWAYNDSGQPLKAIGVFDAFVQEYPEDPRAPEILLKVSQEKFTLGQYDEAIRGYTTFLSRFGDHSFKENVLYQLGAAYIEKKEYNNAIAAYKDLIKEFPDSRILRYAIFGTGKAYQEKQEWKEAIGTYSKIISSGEKDELYARASEARAYCYFQKGPHEKAAQCYFDLMMNIIDFTLSDGVYQWVADFYLTDGNNERSLKVIEVLTGKYPDLASGGEILYMVAENKRQMGDKDEAIRYFNKAISSEVSSPYLERSYLGLGRTYLGMADHANALQFLEKALEEHKDNITGAMARFEIGNSNFQTGNFEEAAKQYMMVAILYSDDDLCPRALLKAGQSFKKAGKTDEAEDAFNELMKKYPDDPLFKEARKELGRLENENQ